MKRIALIAGAGLMALGGIGSAVAQPVSGTPNSPFPYAAPHEIRWINGVPCRTISCPARTPNARRLRRPRCRSGGSQAPIALGDVVSTGSIAPGSRWAHDGRSVSGTPGSPFPYAAPHEIRDDQWRAVPHRLR